MHFEIYTSGFLAMSVCVDADMPVAQIERCCESKNPSGIEKGWKVFEENFATGEANPHPCERESDRLHYLLHC